MRRISLLAFVAASAMLVSTTIARADDSGGGSAPAAYAKWTAGKQPQPGLFTIWRDGGKVYLDAATSQLGVDYIEQAIPVSGLGGWDITPGNPYYDFARIIRFTRSDDKIVITWPNTSFVAPAGTPQQRAVNATFAPSVIALAPIVAEDAAAGRVIFDASALLGDVSDFTDGINFSVGAIDPQSQYHLDPDRTYFGPAKAFPDNDVIEVDQTYASMAPPNSVDNVPDPRSVQLRLDYNIDTAPSDNYTPRIADERVGYYPNIQLQFGNDEVQERQLRYILRWNFAPADPNKPSAATHPMVWYLSDTIPTRFHDAVRDAILAWNPVFAKAGILNAIVVKDQPADPSFDPDDIRYNVVRWLTESNSGGFAQAGSVWDPRTGELYHVGIVMDADLMRFGYYDWRDLVDPTRAAAAALHMPDADYGDAMRKNAAFGRLALGSMGLMSTPAQQNAFDQAFIRSIVLHESGHEMGLEHNFIGSEAYTAKELQSKSFTDRYGVTSSVMEYAPTNVWPKGMSHGDYFQAVPGPYDYHTIHWGYAHIAGATTPQDEVPTLRRWASEWSNPWYSFAMDEDVAYFNAHAIDPRVSQGDLTNDNLSWCDAQALLSNQLFSRMPTQYPPSGEAFDSARTAFFTTIGHLENCEYIVSHYIGGEYVNRSHAGDPGFNGVPLSPVPRAVELRAWAYLDRTAFSENAYQFAPTLLRKLVYTEWVTDFPQPAWAYNPPLRHDAPIADIASGDQGFLLQLMFQPTMLQRLDDLSMKYGAGQTMSLPDLFDWMQSSAFGDLHRSGLSDIPEVHRDLQQTYARMLARMVLHPAAGTPYDARSLARMQLKSLSGDLSGALGRDKLDAVTRAHLESLADMVDQALSAKTVTDGSS